MVDKQYLLNSQQMAEFVARGVLQFDEIVPDEINRAFIDEIDGVADLPAGWTERQSAGEYRLHRRADDALFGFASTPDSWKRLSAMFARPCISSRRRRVSARASSMR